MSTGNLYIVSAPSGAGKTSLLRALNARISNLTTCISHTTRMPRPGEVDGQDYHFVTREQFEHMIGCDEFLEYAKVFDHYYGTSKQAAQDLLNRGVNVILEIDWQGARLVRKRVDAVVSIFILPPSVEELKKRLQLRAQDSEKVIQRRMRDAASEILHYDEFDYWLVNDDFNSALEMLETIFLHPDRYRPPDRQILDRLLADVSQHLG